jgi:hypothetical protein
MIARLPLAGRVMKARKQSTCPLCPEPVLVGQYIARCGTTWYHAACVVRTQQPEPNGEPR